MPTNPDPFARFDPADVAALIAEYPLAWLVSGAGPATEASQLPLIGVYGRDGALTGLIGHFARANPLHAALRADARAAILFRGPEGYVSPEHAGGGDWAPTWNYAQLVVEAEIDLEPEATATALDILIDEMERDRPHPWSVGELGERYTTMLPAIIGFHARVIGLRGKFKLGQDERPERLREILERHPDAALRRWMRRFNHGRG